MIVKHRLVLGLLGGVAVALLLGFLVLMYPTTFVDTWNGAVGASWFSNHTLTMYIHTHCYPYYPFSSQCFVRFDVVGIRFVNGSCTLSHVITTVTWWNNETIVIYHCTAKPTVVVMSIICGTTRISEYPIAITNGTELTPFMC